MNAAPPRRRHRGARARLARGAALMIALCLALGGSAARLARAAALMLALCLALGGGTAVADGGSRSAADLAAAQARFAALRYDEALRLLEQAWHHGDADPARLRAIFSLAGRAAASMGKAGAARLWFQRWLCLEPDAELPPGASPRLRAALTEARAALGGAALTVRAERAGARVELRVEDPLTLVITARLGAARAELAGGRASLPAPRSAGTDAGPPLELLDRDGNVLLSQPLALAAATAPAPAPAPRPPPLPGALPELAWHQRWPTWAYVAGGCVVLAIVSYYVIEDADAEIETDPSSERVRALERRRSIATWGLRGAVLGAGIAATLGVVTYVRGRHRVAPAAPPAGSGTGAGLVWTVSF